jgi:hypothetical protein
MCVNAPHNSGPNYGDLVRVGRGLYKLAKVTSPPPVAPNTVTPTPRVATGSPPPADSTYDWFWEGNVQSAVVSHLAAAGWRIRRVADTASSEHGVDIDADRAGQRLVVEVKGYPGSTYVRGARKGGPKAAQLGAQARTYFGNALLSGLLMRVDKKGARVALAFPRVTTFSSLASRVASPLRLAGVEVWLVSENGSVSELGSNLDDG